MNTPLHRLATQGQSVWIDFLSRDGRPPDGPQPARLGHDSRRSGARAPARAEIARFVGQRKLSLTADMYTHVLPDGRELDYEELLREWKALA
jgi:hypothetical protein